MPSAHDTILAACRDNSFRTRGTWGMRCDVLLGGYKTTERTPCVVLDLARTKPHPVHYGLTVPIVLASGGTWEEVLAKLTEAGELPAPEYTWRIVDYADSGRSGLLRWPEHGARLAAPDELASGTRDACEAAMRLLAGRT